MTKLRIIFWFYIAALLCVTLLIFRGNPYNPIELDPIASYRRAANAPQHLAVIEIRNIALNIAMFIPFGALLPIIWNKARKIYITIPIAITATIAIETAQFITARGVAAAEDIILNTIGAIIGFIFFHFLIKKRLTN
ncbi:MAG: VanZ family protein [Defluviitaleaceae bacterium]|nr:VanZ family protein [Defluviitaleaceae bacterium]